MPKILLASFKVVYDKLNNVPINKCSDNLRLNTLVRFQTKILPKQNRVVLLFIPDLA